VKFPNEVEEHTWFKLTGDLILGFEISGTDTNKTTIINK
jgi:hypothetical protein